MSGRETDVAGVVGAFVDAFNAEDLDALEATLAPTVEIQGRRGLVVGRQEAREWATRRPSGELRQRLVLDGVRADGHPPVALVRRQWHWQGSGELADEEKLAVLVHLDGDGRIASYQPFGDRTEALRAAGLSG